MNFPIKTFSKHLVLCKKRLLIKNRFIIITSLFGNTLENIFNIKSVFKEKLNI